MKKARSIVAFLMAAAMLAATGKLLSGLFRGGRILRCF